MPTESQLEALRMLGAATRGRFDFWMLAGKHLAGYRAVILSKLVGERLPQSKAGVNALRDAFYAAFPVEGDCEAAREENLRIKAQGLLFPGRAA